MLRHQADAASGNLVCGQGGHIVAPEHDFALLRPDDADDAFERGGFAGAVAAQQRHHFTRIDAERYALQDMALAVIAVDIVDF